MIEYRMGLQIRVPGGDWRNIQFDDLSDVLKTMPVTETTCVMCGGPLDTVGWTCDAESPKAEHHFCDSCAQMLNNAFGLKCPICLESLVT